MSLYVAAVQIAEAYHRATVWTAETSGMSEPTLHVHGGLAVFVLSWLVLRRPLAGGRPLLVVVVVALLNEVLDYLHQGLNGPEAVLDTLLTVAWPLALTLAARLVKA